MTLRRRTVEAAAEQGRVIAALLDSGDAQIAARLQRCMASMTTRRPGTGWPWTCRGSGGGCVWCRQAVGRRWWRGLRHWITERGDPVSLVSLPLPHATGGFRAAVARVRRACRDVRDRVARRRASWRGVAVAGMATGSDTVLLLIGHRRIDRREVAEVFEARWPDAVVGGGGEAEPRWAFAADDAAELARLRRGVEPLRIVVLPQRAAGLAATRCDDRAAAPGPVEPMPIVF